MSYQKRLHKYIEEKAKIAADYIINVAENTKQERKMIEDTIKDAWIEGFNYGKGNETTVKLYSEPDE